MDKRGVHLVDLEINHAESQILLEEREEAILSEISTIVSSLKWRYLLYALLDQRPKIWMAESGIPMEAAVDAPPILKECVFRDTEGKQDERIADKQFLVKNEPSAKTKAGPDTWGLTEAYSKKALTGHISEWFGPILMNVPLWKGSVLLLRMWITKMLLTILMSFVVRVGFGHRVSVGEVYSDDRSSPKNAIDTAAHNIFASEEA